MNVPFVSYDADGRVIMLGRVDSVRTALLQGGFVLPGGLCDPEGDYVDLAGTTFVPNGRTDDGGNPLGDVFRGAVRPRPALPRFDKTAIAADGVDAATIPGLPAGATVSVDGGDPVPADGGVVVTSTMPASYDLLVSCWPYLDYRETIVAA